MNETVSVTVENVRLKMRNPFGTLIIIQQKRSFYQAKRTKIIFFVSVNWNLSEPQFSLFSLKKECRPHLAINSFVETILIIYKQIFITMMMQNLESSEKIGSFKLDKTATASKKKYETIFKIGYLLATVLSAILLHKVYLFQTMPQFDNVRQGKIMDFVIYSLPFALLFITVDHFFHKFLDPLCIKYYMQENKYKGAAKEERAYTLVKWIYSIIYYLITSIAGYILIKDTSFFPTWLGGKGACINIINGVPAIPEATLGMQIFYLIQFGKHFARFFIHMFIHQEGNYYEYILHHSLSTFLIFFSYLTNQWLIGIMVLLCHDISDLFLIFCRGYKDYKNYSPKLLNIIYLVSFIPWFGGRLVIFPACCVYPSLVGPGLVQATLNEFEQSILLLPYRWMGFMLVGLQMLQVFWAYYIGKAFVGVSVSEKLGANTYEEG